MSPRADPTLLNRESSWAGISVLVLGTGDGALAVADNLSHLGAEVRVRAAEPNTSPVGSPTHDRYELLGMLGVDFGWSWSGELAHDAPDLAVIAVDPRSEAATALLIDQVVATVQAAEGQVIGELGLAWQLRTANDPPWLLVADRVGAADVTVEVLRAAGQIPDRAGRGGRAVVEAVMDPTPTDVMVVAADALQARFAGAMAAHSAAVVASGDPVRGRLYEGVSVACVYRIEEPTTEELVREAEVVDGARAIGITLGTPGVGSLGLVEDVLADRAFVAERRTSAAEIGTIDDLRPVRHGGSPDPETLLDALTGAALARAFGVEPAAVRNGLRRFRDADR